MRTEIEEYIEEVKLARNRLKEIREERDKSSLEVGRKIIDGWISLNDDDDLERFPEIKIVIDNLKDIRKSRELTREECDLYVSKMKEKLDLDSKARSERREQSKKRIKECDEKIALYSKQAEQIQEIREEYMSGKYTFEQSVRKAQSLGIEVPQYVLDRVDEIEKEKLSQLNPMGGIH